MNLEDAIAHLRVVERLEVEQIAKRAEARRELVKDLAPIAANPHDLDELLTWRRLHPGTHLPGTAAPPLGEEDLRRAVVIGKCRLCGLEGVGLMGPGCPGKRTGAL